MILSQKFIEKKYGKDVSVVRNVPDIVTNKKVIGKKEKLGIRTQLGLPTNIDIVIMQGAGINIDRGAEEAVMAMQYLEHAMLLIIGGGDVIEQLKSLVKKHSLQETVTFFNKMPYDDLLKYTEASDIGLTLDKDTNLNYKYSLPNKLFDYINSGTPILATPLPEIKKIIELYDIGLFVDSHQPQHIASKIKEMLSHPSAAQSGQII